MPVSPAHSTLFPNTARSPSVYSQLYEYLPPSTRTHSRTSSRLPSLPPSPRVPLRQWAERTASEDGLQVSRRTGSETGSWRSGSVTARRPLSASLGEDLEKTGSWIRKSPVRSTKPRRLPSIEDGLMSDIGAAIPMSPVLEASTKSSPAPPGRAGLTRTASPLDISSTSLHLIDPDKTVLADSTPSRHSPPKTMTLDQTSVPPPQPSPFVEKEKEKTGWLHRRLSMKKEGGVMSGILRGRRREKI